MAQEYFCAKLSVQVGYFSDTFLFDPIFFWYITLHRKKMQDDTTTLAYEGVQSFHKEIVSAMKEHTTYTKLYSPVVDDFVLSAKLLVLVLS